MPPTAPQPYGSPAGPHGPAPSNPPGWGQPAYGQPHYTHQPPWQNGSGAFRASGGLGIAVIVLSSVLTVAYWTSALLSPGADRQYEDAIADGRATGDVFTTYDVVNLVTFFVMIAAWVVTCVWLGRARDNALVLNPGGQRRSTVWVWLGWVVPIVAFWFPKQILDDTIKSTAPAAGEREFSTGGYWAAWIVMSLLSNAQFRLSIQAEPQDVVMPGLEFAMAIATTVALGFWVLLVRRISDLQDRLAANGVNGR